VEDSVVEMVWMRLKGRARIGNLSWKLTRERDGLTVSVFAMEFQSQRG
jgi:hypothetical protein